MQEPFDLQGKDIAVPRGSRDFSDILLHAGRNSHATGLVSLATDAKKRSLP